MIRALVPGKAAVLPATGGSVRDGFLPGVTTVILTLDEEMHIARAIKSARRFSREVLVVDSFSHDRTVEIARSMGARVVQNAWINYARQFASRLRSVRSAPNGSCASMRKS